MTSTGELAGKTILITGASRGIGQAVATAAAAAGASTLLCARDVPALERLADGIEAAGGSESAQQALAKLGLSAADLAGLSPDEQFKRMADGIARIEDPALRVAVEDRGATFADPLLAAALGDAELVASCSRGAPLGAKVQPAKQFGTAQHGAELRACRACAGARRARRLAPRWCPSPARGG